MGNMLWSNNTPQKFIPYGIKQIRDKIVRFRNLNGFIGVIYSNSSNYLLGDATHNFSQQFDFCNRLI